MCVVHKLVQMLVWNDDLGTNDVKDFWFGTAILEIFGVRDFGLERRSWELLVWDADWFGIWCCWSQMLVWTGHKCWFGIGTLVVTNFGLGHVFSHKF